MDRTNTNDRSRHRRDSATQSVVRKFNNARKRSGGDGSIPVMCVIGAEGCLVRDNRAVESWEMGAAESAGPIEGLPHQVCPYTECQVKSFTRHAYSEVKRGRSAEAKISVPCLKHVLDFRVTPLELKQARTSGVALVQIEDLTERRTTEDQLRSKAETLSGELEQRNAQLERLNAALQYEIQEHQRTEAALRNSESESHLLSAQLFSAQEMERKRIASELHDGIGASLGVIRQGLDRALLISREHDCALVESALEAITPQLKRTVNDLRRVAMDLRPSTLDDIGILATLSWFMREFGEANPKVAIEKRIDIKESDVPVALKTVIFRVAQEAFNNIAKHARATRIGLALNRDGGTIELAVRDNGIGFDPARLAAHRDTASGMGLGSMRERVEMSAGRFRIDTTPGQGAQLVATWLHGSAKN